MRTLSKLNDLKSPDGETLRCGQARGVHHLAQAPAHGSHQDYCRRRRRQHRFAGCAANAGDAHRAVAIVQVLSQDRGDSAVRPTDGQVLGQDGERISVYEPKTQDDQNIEVSDDQ